MPDEAKEALETPNQQPDSLTHDSATPYRLGDILEEVGRRQIGDDDLSMAKSEGGPGQSAGPVGAEQKPEDATGQTDQTGRAEADPKPEEKPKEGEDKPPADLATLERRLKDTQDWGHKASEKAKTLEAENKQLRERIEAIEKEERERNRPKPITKEERAAKLTEALRAIDELDPEADDYAAQRAAILAEAFDSPAPAVDEYTVEEKVRQVLKAEKEAESAQEREARLVGDAEKMAKDAGLDMTPGSRDYRLFWDAINRAPMGEGTTLKQQVDFMVGEVKGLYDSIRQEILASVQKADENQTQNAVLERGGTPTPASQATSHPMSISDHMEQIYSGRRL